MRTRHILLGLVLTTTFLLACEALREPNPAPAEEEGDPARDAWVLPDEMGGIYTAQCAVCHGATQELSLIHI